MTKDMKRDSKFFKITKSFVFENI